MSWSIWQRGCSEDPTAWPSHTEAVVDLWHTLRGHLVVEHKPRKCLGGNNLK